MNIYINLSDINSSTLTNIFKNKDLVTLEELVDTIEEQEEEIEDLKEYRNQYCELYDKYCR